MRLRFLHHLSAPTALAAAMLASGCATTAQLPSAVQTPAALAPPDAQDVTGTVEIRPVIEDVPAGAVPVVRYGRYTLVELLPEPAQRDLTRQVIEVAIPPSFDASVGDALRHVLLRTGYRLCDAADAAPLYALPLPAAHLRLGPLPLRDALLALAGPAWQLSIDDGARQVCFQRRARTAMTPPLAASASAQTPRSEPEEVRP
jgi:type IV pili sensor histidine kinase/response regulator